MNILLVNTSSHGGGAALAARRLLLSLVNRGIFARMFAQTGVSESNIIINTNSKVKQKISFLKFVFEKIIFIFYQKSKLVRFAFSFGTIGSKVSKNEVFDNVDIIHLHWINNSFLSIKELSKIFKLNKPVVWTLHDMWLFTGGCHYSGTCDNYNEQCGYCPFLRVPGKNDLSNRLFKLKENLLKNKNLTIVTCSEWLKEKAEESTILKNYSIQSIPNPIDTEFFSPKDKTDARNKLLLPHDKHLVLFGSANISDTRKGLQHLIDGLKYLAEDKPLTVNDMHIVVFGKIKNELELINNIPFPLTFMHYISEEQTLVDLYNAVDIFVLPSLEDNLPNTIMESLSCGTPVVAYNTGGIPEMIDHQSNGYLAEYRSAVDIADGIYWTIYLSEYEEVSAAARKKVLDNYTQNIVADKYISLYQSLIKNK